MRRREFVLGTIGGLAAPFRAASSEIHPPRPLNRGLSVDKFDLHSIDLSYGPWQKSRKGSDQPRAWREPCNCRERFFHFGAGERLTDAAMRTRTKNRMPSRMVLGNVPAGI